ncbi:MAG TPA: 16S rRNA (adenine(1518)-N(6)/adenine(1519)-N(6))-dimethyltransferase RsmA [Candidatus Helicobacter avistercoris]|nr:16S rRNA (adenine(1518)-N(6)/adenine(1519)-N(6))-dimethyltransferase RsmA [Candidatus Helicobacter avistercoris]
MHYKAKKKYGQNFLKDSFFLRQIVQAIPNTSSQVIEIGIGLGDLTDELLKIHNLIAYEVDEDLCSLLAKRHSSLLETQKLRLILGDVLEIEGSTGWLHPEPYFLVSNLPYYIATLIVLKLLRDEKCKGFVVMTQKEVAEKFCAQVGEKEFCALSVIAQSVGEIELLFEVPASAFEPAPKVTSAVFRVIKKPNHPRMEEIEKLEVLLKAAFCAPRKKLEKNLANFYPKQEVEEIFSHLGIDKNLRPHQVSTTLYHQILEYEEKYGKQRTKEYAAPQ